MKRIKKRWIIAILFGILLFFIWINNTNLFADKSGTYKLLAHRGLAQNFDISKVESNTNTAAIIYEPEHPYLENTIESMQVAYDYGADCVELDIQLTKDKQIACFHDNTLEYRTDGTGTISDYTMDELKQLDIGYGYTADGGKTYPFRGKGVGLMPSLSEVFRTFPNKEFLLHIRSYSVETGEVLYSYLSKMSEEQIDRITIYGSKEPLEYLHEKMPTLRVMNKDILIKALLNYEALGWTGYIPECIKNKDLHIPLKYARYLWGWPNKFMERMDKANTKVILVKGDGEWSEGFDSLEEMSELPKGFTGYVWTNRIDKVSSCNENWFEMNRGDMKFHPGHYVAVVSDFNISDIKFLDEPAIIGVNKRYRWRDLEPSKDTYDFSLIENDLKYLSDHNKQLVVFLIDRSFVKRGAMPDYLSKYEFETDTGGFIPLRWNSEVKERLIKLGEEIGKKFDSYPNFEGVALQESALDMTEKETKKYEYSISKYRNALIDIIISFQKSMPRSHVFWYGNFISGDDKKTTNLRKVMDSIVPYGVIWGGPDILPYHKSYNERSYPLFEEYEDRLTLFSSAQDDSYRHYRNDLNHEVKEPIDEGGYLTMEDIFLFARDKLHIRYLFWNYFYEAKEGQRTYDDAVEVIKKYPSFNNTIGPLGSSGH